MGENKTDTLEKKVADLKPEKVGHWEAFVPKEKRKATFIGWLITIGAIALCSVVGYLTTPTMIQYAQDKRAAENKRQMNTLSNLPLHRVDTSKDGATIYGIMYNCIPDEKRYEIGINQENFRTYFKMLNELGFGDKSDTLQPNSRYYGPCANKDHKNEWIDGRIVCPIDPKEK